MKQSINEILFKLRTTHEVEHNNNQWTTEFVYPLDEAKQQLRTLLDEIADEIIDGERGATFGYGGDIQAFGDGMSKMQEHQRTKKSEILDRAFGKEETNKGLGAE